MIADKLTVEQFKELIRKHQISRWNIRLCSICEYCCGYVFIEGYVYYDSGCYCTGRNTMTPATWGEVTNAYNQTSDNFLDKVEMHF